MKEGERVVIDCYFSDKMLVTSYVPMGQCWLNYLYIIDLEENAAGIVSEFVIDRNIDGIVD